MPRSVDLDDYPHLGAAGGDPRARLAPAVDPYAATWRDLVVWTGGRLSPIPPPDRRSDRPSDRPDDRPDDPVRERPRVRAPE